ALPMLRGLVEALGAPPEALVVSTEHARQAWDPAPLPAGARFVAADHPTPTERSGAAAAAATAVVSEPGRLIVLLSGGASALLCTPAPGLTLADKRDATAAVARAGADIRALNVVRKHLSAIKGGRLALAARGPVRVLLLSDVVGDEAAVVA